MTEVEKWNSWDYPSHWEWHADFKSYEEALEFVEKQKNKANYRIIQVLWNEGN